MYNKCLAIRRAFLLNKFTSLEVFRTTWLKVVTCHI